MPLPLLLGIGMAIAAGGVGSGIHGAMKMKDANDTMQLAKDTQEEAIKKFEKNKEASTKLIDSIDTQELNIIDSFKTFSDLIEKIQGRPEFKQFNRDGVELPQYDPDKLKEVSTGSRILLSSVCGAANASVSASGVALGATILGAVATGVGLLVGGIIFDIAGSKLSSKADEALSQAMDTEEAVDKVCSYLAKLNKYARKFKKSLSMVENCYKEHLEKLNDIINNQGKTQWNDFTSEEKKITENSVLLVGLLYKMSQVKLVLKDKDDDGRNEVNVKGVMDIEADADKIIENEIAA